jgi:hypothetical protein
MHRRLVPLAVAAALLLLGSSPASAAEQGKAPAHPAAGESKAGAQSAKPKPVDINSASAAQLKTVPGIGDAEAQRIIIHRPYPTRSHLVTKNVLSYDAYMALKDRIVAVPPEPSKAKK